MTSEVLIELETLAAALAATRATQAAGYRAISLHLPYSAEVPDDVLALLDGDAKGGPRLSDRVAPVALVAGLVMALAAIAMQGYANVFDEPHNVGGRPPFSWPAFVPITFELLVLGAAFGAVIAMFAQNGLPRLHHRLFSNEAFARLAQGRYFLLCEVPSGTDGLDRARELFSKLGALSVSLVASLELDPYGADFQTGEDDAA